jgi:predicted nucleotidyltransferase
MGETDFWLEPHKVVLKDGREVTLRPEILIDLEPTWEMMSTLSRESLQFLSHPFTRERVEGWFKRLNYNVALPILGAVKENEREDCRECVSIVWSE